MAGFLAYIIPIDQGAHPEHPIAGGPPGIWGPTDPRPTPPIVLPIPPDAIAPGVPTHPIYIPVVPAHPIVIPPEAIGPGVPTHPIVLPPLPPEIWPKPGHPAHPIVIPPESVGPGVPTHPIVLPPVTIWPPGPGVGDEHPAHPIELPDAPTEPPPTDPPTNPEDPNWTWGWSGGRWRPTYVPGEGTPTPKA